MTTDTNGAGGLPVNEKYDAYYDHPGNTCQYPGHMKLQYPNGELHYLPAGTRLFIEHGELCRATREGDGKHPIEMTPEELIAAALRVPGLEREIEELRTLSRVAVQEGMVMVPIEPTCGMVVAAIDRDDSAEDASPDGLYVGIYRAMIAAAQRQEG